MTDDLAQDLGGQETATLEWKREATDRHALRKAICALANDLTGAGGGVLAPARISWFTDRVEITNPGGPFGQVRDDNFARVNDYRNPSVAAAMKTLGYANRFGRGITRVQSVLRANGNPPADFDVTAAYWSVTLGSSS